ncbi:Sulfite exporter TauE/SafE [Thermomonospora echinospora]|uniref:Sulfite exporter TauE/SafE n=1 Tax=Thermomonospora echinospora TaxID=1992 RepID=A0A1H6E4E5_9ACTN|nr:sulfite exporter TauE/SafE family protein [Thermomonospora echinospora]SEG92618.1 Sulfite exporter TauE/SafE [Thermomonospora echinospora]
MAGSAGGGTVALFAAGAGTGLLAGAASCASVQFGLLTGAVREAGRPLLPVIAFLTAKLAAHTVLGALLGAVGAAVAPGPRVRAALLVAAGVLLTVFALDLLGVPAARRLLRREGQSGHCAAPPAGRGPGVVGNPGAARSPGAFGRLRRPVALGAFTVLVPCGLTLSAELLAVGSRSALGGAAVMAGFVLGTAPVFALLGMALGRGLGALGGGLGAVAGAVVLVVAGWTLMSGLRLGGWLPSPGQARAVAEGSAEFVRTDGAGVQTITVWALDRGYRPSAIVARSGLPTVLVVRTRETRGCTRAFVIPGRDLERMLPVTGETRIPLGSPAPGRLRYTCASGHYPGGITFRR